MARPKKCTVDYFPHYVTGNSRTVFILEQKYGNDGYALWFKLLELLAVTDGHYVDFNDHTDLEFFAAKAKIDADKAIEIIDQLASLKAIDRQLWKQKIVWCQNFVDNLSELYARRRVSLPQKPSLNEFMYVETSTSEGLCTTETPKVKESKVEDSKEKKSREEKSKEKEICFEIPFLSVFENRFGVINPNQITSNILETLNFFNSEGIDKLLVDKAIDVAMSKDNRSISYVCGILNKWLGKGIKTLEMYEDSKIVINNGADDFKALLQRGPI